MLQVNFKIDERVTATVQKASRESSDVIVLVVIEAETMKQLGDPIRTTGGVAGDFEKVRSVLTAEKLQAAYAVVFPSKLADPTAIVVYTSDSAKAKDRMMYSSGLAHLKDLASRSNPARRAPIFTAQAATIAEIQPSLLNRKQDAQTRESLMTESERQQAAIAKMPVAPQPTAMPGVEIPLSSEARKLLQTFNTAQGMVITFKIEDNQIAVDKQQKVPAATDKNEQLALAKSLLPQNEPRYVLTDYCKPAGKARVVVMVYVCPSACPPKVKMPYASGRASFLAQLTHAKVIPARRIETGSASELAIAVEESFIDITDSIAESKPQTGKPPGARGPRMLI